MRRRHTNPESAQRGFTLIELMISLVIFSFAIAGVLAAAVSMSQGLHEQRQAIDAELAARVPLDYLQDALRQASPGAPTLNIQDVHTCAIGAVTVTNNMGGAGWDQLDVIYASGAVVTSLRTAYGTGTTSITVTDASQLAIGDYIVISNLNQGHFVQITGIGGNVLTLAAQCGATILPTGGYAAGAIVIRAQHSIFYIAPVDGIPTLMMNASGDPSTNALEPAGNGEPLAAGIEDLQIALGVDTGTDGVSEVGTNPGDDEWLGNVAGDPGSIGGVWTISGTLRAVRITLIARTTLAEIGATTPFTRPAAEDHAQSTTPDAYRRRVLKTTAEIRNVGASP